MSAYAVLALDTTAPVVTWGEPSDAINSEPFSVPYTLNEPEIESADMLLLDGRVVPLDVGDDTLSTTLPDDAVEGWATVRAHVVDDVGNRAIRTFAVYVTGVIPTQPVASPGQPHPPVAAVDHLRSTPSRAATRSRYTLSATSTFSGRVAVRSSYLTPTRRAVAATARARLVAEWTSTATAGPASARAATRSQDSVRKRPEGPGAEDELLLLGLL